MVTESTSMWTELGASSLAFLSIKKKSNNAELKHKTMRHCTVFLELVSRLIRHHVFLNEISLVKPGYRSTQ